MGLNSLQLAATHTFEFRDGRFFTRFDFTGNTTGACKRELGCTALVSPANIGTLAQLDELRYGGICETSLELSGALALRRVIELAEVANE